MNLGIASAESLSNCCQLAKAPQKFHSLPPKKPIQDVLY
jgi:hypothetical protein